MKKVKKVGKIKKMKKIKKKRKVRNTCLNLMTSRNMKRRKREHQGSLIKYHP